MALIGQVVSEENSDFAGLNFCPATLAGRHEFQSDIFHFFRTKEKYFLGGGGGGGGGRGGGNTLLQES